MRHSKRDCEEQEEEEGVVVAAAAVVVLLGRERQERSSIQLPQPEIYANGPDP